jgi:N-acetylglucosaminyldiphosphoundecaprenol N-acetyl-beta-D-mannosaminyltransferase
MRKQALLNTFVNNVSMSEAVAEILRLAAEKKKSYVVAINVDVVMKM